MTLPIINSTFTQDMWGLFEYANVVSDGLFGISLVLVISTVFIIRGIITAGFIRGISQGGFVAMILTMFLGVGQVVDPSVVVTVILLYLLWLGYLIYRNQSSGGN